MSEGYDAVPGVPGYAYPPRVVPDYDAATARLAAVLQEAWDRVEAEKERLFALVEGDARWPRIRDRLDGYQAEIRAFQGTAAEAAEQMVGVVTGQYANGVVIAAATTGAAVRWTPAHERVVAVLAADTYEDLLARAQAAGRVGDRLVRAVRRVAREEMPFQATGGKTARDVGRAIRQRLERDYRIGAVTYSDGSVHSVREYTEMLGRTKGRVAQNSGSLNSYYEMGVQYMEVFDGGDCGWTDHRSPDKANGTIRTVEACAAHPISHPNCVAAGTRVTPLGSVHAAYRAPYDGPMIVLSTAVRPGGLTVTPNHPVLTGRGWLPAHAVKVGDHVLTHAVRDAGDAGVDEQDVEPRVEQMFDLASEAGSRSRGVPAPEHFHGDAARFVDEVDVVDVDGVLLYERDAVHGGAERHLVHRRPERAVPGRGAGAERIGRVGGAPASVVRGTHVGGVRGSGPDLDAALAQPLADSAVADAELAREVGRRFAVEVAPDEVVEVRNVDAWRGHVYDLSTAGAAYVADGILVHNCRRTFGPRPDVSRANAGAAKPLQNLQPYVDEAYERALLEDARRRGL